MPSSGFGLSDPFKGLRDFPRTSTQLRNHLSAIHRTLQCNYFVDPETAQFALHPERGKDFYDTYRKEVEKIFRHLTKVTQRSIKVRVDPFRSKGGYEVKVLKSSSESSSSSSYKPATIEEDPAWVARMTALGRKLLDAARIDASRQRTPEDQTPILQSSVIDSSLRVHQNSEVFCTPPEFMGFKRLELNNS